MNIVEPILFHCKAQAPVAAMCAPGHALPLVSYGRLEQFIYNVARHARAQGLGPGNVVALLIDEPILHAAFILGLAYLGVETVSVRTADVPKELRVDAVIADKTDVFKNAGRVIIADTNWLAGDGRPMPDHAAPAGGACRIILTSGTTGDPKGVAFSHDMLIERIARHNWTFGSGVPSCSRIFVDPGLGTAIGFLFWLYTLAKGGTVVVRGPDAVETMQAFILYNVQCMVASPAALAEFVGYYEEAPTLTAPVEIVLSVGGLLPRSLSERLRARICSNLIACYGSTEANIVATAPAHAIADTAGAVGFITPGVTVGIVDRSGNPVPAGGEGLVRISGPYHGCRLSRRRRGIAGRLPRWLVLSRRHRPPDRRSPAGAVRPGEGGAQSRRRQGQSGANRAGARVVRRACSRPRPSRCRTPRGSTNWRWPWWRQASMPTRCAAIASASCRPPWCPSGSSRWPISPGTRWGKSTGAGWLN